MASLLLINSFLFCSSPPLRNLDIDKLSGNYVPLIIARLKLQQNVAVAITNVTQTTARRCFCDSWPLFWLIPSVMYWFPVFMWKTQLIRLKAHCLACPLLFQSISHPIWENMSVSCRLWKSLTWPFWRPWTKLKRWVMMAFPSCAVLNISTQRQQTYIFFSRFRNIC